MASSSNLIDIRMKLSGGRAVVSGLSETKTETEKLGKATSKTSRISHAATGTTSRLTTAFKAMGAHAKLAFGLVGAGSLFAIESAVHNTEELSKTTTNLSKSFGLNVKAASEWGAVAQSREIDARSMSMSFASLSKQMVEAARKGGTLLTPFHQLGLSQEDVAKGAKNFSFGLNETLEALSAMPGGAKKMTAAKTVLGRGYQTLIPLLNESAMGFKEQLHWASEFGDTLDGKTSKTLEGMRIAQIKNKIAMHGLQVSVAEFLTPAIEAGDEQLQNFIKTLNSPNLTAEQKIKRISTQFQGIEADIIKVIERALPAVAEQAGRLGIVAAKSLGSAFLHANVLGKIAIAGYVFKLLGGKSLVLAGAKTVGGMMGTSLGLGLGLGAVGAFVAYEVWEHLSARTKIGVIKWGREASESFVNVLIGGINTAIERINTIFDEANILSAVGVDAPNIGRIGEVDNQAGLLAQEEEAKLGLSEGKINGPNGTEIPAYKPPGSKGKTRPKHQSVPRKNTAFWGGSDRPIHVHVEVDKKEIGFAALSAAKHAAALR